MLRLILWSTILAAGCLFAPSAPLAGKIPVTVSIVPQGYFVEQIGGDLVTVQVMVQPGASPATYEPKPRQMASLATSTFYFAIGVPFETVWLEKIVAASPDMTIIHTDEGIVKRFMKSHHHRDAADDLGHDDHADEKTPDRETMEPESGLKSVAKDPHVWLSPRLVKHQLIRIRDALIKADPSHEGLFRANHEAFAARVDLLDMKLKTLFANRRGLHFMVFHPSWGYFADAYGLKQIPVEIEGKTPKPSQLKTLIQYAREYDINVVFVQPQFSLKSARLIAREIRGTVVIADPLAKDWLTNLETVADRFREALK